MRERPPRWSQALEARYQRDLTERIMPIGRLAALAGALLFVGLSAWDEHIDPGNLSRTVPIRLFVAGLFLMAFTATFTALGRRTVGPYMLLHLTVGVGYPLVLAALDGGFVAGVPGLILAMIVVPILSTRWWHAATALLVLVLLPNVVMLTAGATRFEVIQANYWFGSGAAVAAALTYLMASDRRRAFTTQVALEAEQHRSDELLHNILPADIVVRLKHGDATTTESFAEATVLFADLARFTDFAESASAEELVTFLNELFSTFDDVADAHGIEKVKTVGDAYMAVSGVPVAREDHAAAAVGAGLAMLDAFERINRERKLDLGLRVGVHTGPLVGGVIGRRKYTYDVWGDTVNVASRMESGGRPGFVQVSESTAALLGDTFELAAVGPITLKHHTDVPAFLVVAGPQRSAAGSAP